MGLNFLAGRAVRVVRVLVVTAPDAFVIRVAAERAVIARGWRLASTPAEADVLFQAGRVFGELVEVAGRLWDQLPGPRARVAAEVVTAVGAALDEAATLLLDDSLQAEDAAGRTAPDLGQDSGGMDMDGGSMDHGSMDHGNMDHEDMDHSGMDHSGMDHGDMGMDMNMSPDGIPLAEGSEDDRDGLEMDVLPVRLGPVLPDWPDGLVLDVTLHGDVILTADARFVDTGGGDSSLPVVEVDPATDAARTCDDMAAVLSLAGWPDAAALARAARNAVLDRRDIDALATLENVRRRVVTSRILRWSLRRTGTIDPERARRLGLPESSIGDCYQRLLGLLGRARELIGGSPLPPPAPVPLDALGQLVLGFDLAAARLLVASLGSPAAEGVAADA